jgi:hypothetical protein
MRRDDIFTPGRISWVYFNHRFIVEELEHKPKGWFVSTAGGFLEAPAESESINKSEVEVEVEVEVEASTGEGITGGGERLGLGFRQKIPCKRYQQD